MSDYVLFACVDDYDDVADATKAIRNNYGAKPCLVNNVSIKEKDGTISTYTVCGYTRVDGSQLANISRFVLKSENVDGYIWNIPSDHKFTEVDIKRPTCRRHRQRRGYRPYYKTTRIHVPWTKIIVERTYTWNPIVEGDETIEYDVGARMEACLGISSDLEVSSEWEEDPAWYDIKTEIETESECNVKLLLYHKIESGDILLNLPAIKQFRENNI